MRNKYMALLTGLGLCGIGCAAWIMQLIKGLSITGLNNLFSWGLYMGSFEFFISLSTGGMLLFSIAYIWNLEYLKPFVRLGAIASFGSIIAAGVAIITDLGQPLNSLQMLLTPNLKSPLIWDVAVLGAYAFVCFLGVCFQFLPELRRFKFSRNKKLNCEVYSRRLAYVAFPLIFIMDIVTAMMFAVQNTREWWHSALLPVDSMTVATALGTSFMMLLICLMTGKEEYAKKGRAFSLMANVARCAILLHLVFTAAELGTLAWSSTHQSQHLLGLLFGEYGLLYMCELIFPVIALLGFSVPFRRNKRIVEISGILAVIAFFIHRMMHLLPAFNSVPMTIPVATLPESIYWTYPISLGVFKEGQDAFAAYWNYNPTFAEWGVALLPAGIVIAMIAMANCIFSLSAEMKQESM